VKATIYHNPRCSKSREGLALLEAAGAEVTVVEYLKNPPSRDELERLCAALLPLAGVWDSLVAPRVAPNFETDGDAAGYRGTKAAGGERAA